MQEQTPLKSCTAAPWREYHLTQSFCWLHLQMAKHFTEGIRCYPHFMEQENRVHQKRSTMLKVTSKARGGRNRWHVKALSLFIKYSSEILTPNTNTICISFYRGCRFNAVCCLLNYKLE